jgi:hypothetical protein
MANHPRGEQLERKLHGEAVHERAAAVDHRPALMHDESAVLHERHAREMTEKGRSGRGLGVALEAGVISSSLTARGARHSPGCAALALTAGWPPA